MNRLFYKIISIFILLFYQSSFSQSLITYNYSVEDGLPSSETYDILQDSKGYIWVATDRGVCRYDGYSFHTFTTEDGLTDNTIFNLYEDDSGRIWFLTFNRSLSYYKDEKIIPYKYNKKLKDAIPKASIMRSLSCSGDTVTIGYIIGGIVTINPDGKLKKTDSPTHPDIPSYSAIEKNNALTISSYSSLKMNVPGKENLIMQQKNLLFFKTKRGQIKIESPLTHVQINIRGLKRRNGNYLIYFPGMLVEVDPFLNYHTIPLPDKEILQLFEDRDSSLWISYRRSGVQYYAPNEGISSEKYQQFFNGESITSICEDNEKGYWVTTLQNGIFFIPSIHYKMFTTDGAVKTDVVALTGDGAENIFYGDKNGNVNVLHPDPFSHFTQKIIPGKNGVINTLYYDLKEHALWIGGNIDMEVSKDLEKSVQVLDKAVKAMAESDNENSVWQSASLQLFKLDRTSPFKIMETINTKIRTDVVYTDQNDKLWIGANDGLYKLMGKDIIFCGYDDSLLRSRISDIKGLTRDRLALATIGNGIIIKDEEKTRKISTKDGVCSNIINGIAVEGDTIWAATNKGLCRIAFINEKLNVVNYNTSHGMPTDELRKVYVQNGKLWIGTSKGLVEVDKRNLVSNSSSPPIYLNFVSINDSNIQASQNDTLKINYDDYLIKINFVGLSFKKQEKINYRYVLHGLNDDWQYTTGTTIQFTSLRPGNYSFEVYAQNENGRWSERPIKLFFNVRPPYWITWWFILAVSLVVGGILFSIIFYRIRQLTNRNLILEQVHNYKMQALTLQMNPHFLFNTLNSIQAYVLTEDKKNASKYLSKFAKLMRLELSNLQKEYIPLADEVDMLNIYMELEELRFKNKFRFEMIVDESIEQEKVLIPSMLIQPYLENAVKHGMMTLKDAAPGNISTKIFFEGKKLICIVNDNGGGREAAKDMKKIEKEKHESAGMKITEDRLKLLCENNGQEFVLFLSDEKNTDGTSAGTKIEFALPYKIVNE